MKYIGFPRPSYPLWSILEARYLVFYDFSSKRNVDSAVDIEDIRLQ